MHDLYSKIKKSTDPLLLHLEAIDRLCREGKFDQLRLHAKQAMKEPLFIEDCALGLQLINQIRLAIGMGDMKVEDGKEFYDYFKKEMIARGETPERLKRLLMGYEVFETKPS